MDTLTENISEKISQILWGKSFVDVADQDGNEQTLILRSLSIRENNYLNFIYDKEYRLAQQEGILTHDQLERFFYAQDVWGKTETGQRDSIQKELRILSGQLKDSEFHTVRKRKIEKRIKKISTELTELNGQELSLFSVSAENRAEEIKRRFMIYLFAETDEEKPLWSSKEEFMQSRDSILLNNIIVAYFTNNIYPEASLRRIARSGEWRFRWAAAKHGEQLFGKPISEWSEMQNMLVYWSSYYDGIYESMERPGDHIIENDVACDNWVLDQNKKVSQNRMVSKKNSGQKTDHGERFVMVAKDDKESVDKVQNMNPDAVRDQLKKEFEQISKTKGRLKEWDLGGRKESTVKNFKRRG